MIPKILHYCWFGKSDLPEMAKECIDSWHALMPDWTFRRWDETSFDVDSHTYTKEAYAARQFAFVSDYVRLWVLEREGGVYMDVDFLVHKPFDPLLVHHAFAGFEGSKHLPVMMGVCGSEPHGQWVGEMLNAYANRHFIVEGRPDLTTNVQFVTAAMAANGFLQNGKEQDYKDLHVFPVDYFSPRQTTGEYFRTENTYCEHLGLNSWAEVSPKWKQWIKTLVGPKIMTRIIKLKRSLT